MRRSFYDIYAAILERGSSDLVEVMGRLPNVSYDVLAKHLRKMVEVGLVVEGKRNGRIFYRRTERGLKYHRAYRRLRELLGSVAE